MAVMLPTDLVWVLNLLGFNWPEADEDKLRECAQHWREFAADVGHVKDDANRIAARVTSQNEGASIDAFQTYWRGIGGGGGHLDEAQEAANLAADALDAFAVLIEGIKAAIIAQLIILAAEIIADQLAAPETFGLSEGAAVAETVATRSILRALIDDGVEQVTKQVIRELKNRAREIFLNMLKRALITGALSAGLDFARQEIDINVFHSRQGLSWTELGTAGGIGGAFGATSTLFHLRLEMPGGDGPTSKLPYEKGMFGGDYTACFVAGTLVMTERGARPIEQIQPGERVIAQPSHGRLGLHRVSGVHVGSAARLFRVELGRGSFVATGRHRVSVEDRGWTPVRELSGGETLEAPTLRRTGVHSVEIEEVAEEVPTYNLTVEDVSTYLVLAGCQALLVHNDSGGGGDPNFDQVLYWLFGKKPGLRDTDVDGLSVWKTSSRDDVNLLMEYRVNAMDRKAKDPLSYWTEQQMAESGLSHPPTPSELAASDYRLSEYLDHHSIRPGGMNDPSVELGPDEMTSLRTSLDQMPSTTQVKPGSLEC